MNTRRLLGFSLLAFGFTGLVGCQSAREPGSMSHASVRIAGHSEAEIRQTAATVFREQGYTPDYSTPAEIVFDRPGSRLDAAKWGGLAGGGVTMRVKVRLRPQPDGSHLLIADAYAVQNASDPFFQTESRNVILNRRPYQRLLNEVAARLK